MIKKYDRICCVSACVVLVLLSAFISYEMSQYGNGMQWTLFSTVEYALWTMGNTCLDVFLCMLSNALIIGIVFCECFHYNNGIFRKLLCFFACVCVLMTLIVFYIQNGAIYPDNLFIVLIGISTGYYMMKDYINAVYSRRHLSQRNPWHRVYYTLVLLSICVVIILQLALPYGLIRLNINNSPDLDQHSFSALATDSNMREVYRLDGPRTAKDKVKWLSQIFNLHCDWQRIEKRSATSLRGYIATGNDSNKAQLTVWDDLSWHYICDPPYNAKASYIAQDDAIKIARMSIMPLLQEDEDVRMISIVDDYLRDAAGQEKAIYKRVSFQIISSCNDVQYNGDKITVDVADGRAFSILCVFNRYVLSDTVAAISQKRAYCDSRSVSAQYTYFKKTNDWQLISVDETYKLCVRLFFFWI